MTSRRLGWIAAFAIAAFIGGCSNSNNSGGVKGDGPKCDIDAQCGRGQVCLGGYCGTVECQSLTDCGDGQICAPAEDGSGNVCTSRECTANGDCGAGGACTDGLCSGGTPTGCEGDDDCEGDQTCNTATGKCEGGETPQAPTGACAPCGEEAQCETGLNCTKIAGADHCLAPCEDTIECASGWYCLNGFCSPGQNSCAGCLANGCQDETKHCNPDNGTCIATPGAEECKPCQTHGECGAGMRCFGKKDTKYCVPECMSGTCPDNGECVDLGDGVMGCSWKTAGPCCWGTDCGGSTDPCDACGGPTPHCNNNVCVECLNDSHCGGDTPSCKNNQCVSDDQPPMCSGSKPHWSEAKSECCECLNDTHCNGLFCNSATCQCQEGGDDVCATCADPYPACADFQGNKVCVQCVSDDDCPTTCDTETFTCDGNVPPASGNCQQNGCSLPELTCDTTTGLCFDPAGNCDTVAQFCINGGQCLDFFTQFTSCLGGGGGGGFPIPLPSGGIPGNCECELGAGEIPGIGQGNCPDGLACGPNILGALFCGLGGGGQSGPNVCQAPIF